jgi:hypothetical protein
MTTVKIKPVNLSGPLYGFDIFSSRGEAWGVAEWLAGFPENNREGRSSLLKLFYSFWRSFSNA